MTTREERYAMIRKPLWVYILMVATFPLIAILEAMGFSWLAVYLWPSLAKINAPLFLIPVFFVLFSWGIHYALWNEWFCKQGDPFSEINY